MLNTIERRLQKWSDATVDGLPADTIFADPDYDVYRRAFRLKRFGRCPHCDEKAMITSYNPRRFGNLLGCESCLWSLFIWDYLELEPDNLILDIVRGVPSV